VELVDQGRIGRDLKLLLATELGRPARTRVTVEDGIVRLTGPTDPTSQPLAGCAAGP
jgi:hypothetical protein